MLPHPLPKFEIEIYYQDKPNNFLTMECLISKALIDSNVNHDEFVSTDHVLK